MNPSPETPPRPPSAEPWTPDQAAAICHVESDLLVSAAAGSGKTAVLAERCAWLVCDAPEPCEVDELLVVTFTEAAAAEMKQRIAAALRRRLLEASEPAQPRLMRQLALLDRAQISTLHAFCANLIRRHHALLNLDPAFTVLDGDEAELLKREVVKTVFEGRYDGALARNKGNEPSDNPSAAADFSAFIDDYGDGSDERLMKQVIAAHELLQSVVDPEQWQAEAHRRLEEGAQRPLSRSELGRALIGRLRGHLDALQGQCERTGEILARMPGFEKYTELLREWDQAIRYWRGLLPPADARQGEERPVLPEEDDWLDRLAEEVRDVPWPRLPAVKSDVPGKDQAKKLMDAMKKALKEGPLVELLNFSRDQWRQGMRDILPHAGLFLDLVREFSQSYSQAKQNRQGLDFSDLERLALRALNQPAAAADCRRRFRHVLVDEYQDINQVQDAILSLVTGEGENPRERAKPPRRRRPCAFYVGDVKQSIYRFRLAEPARFLERQSRFRRAERGCGRVIDLQKNFRSRAPLLEAINHTFVQLMTAEAAEIEYDQSHHLHPGADYAAGDGPSCFRGSPIELHLLPPKTLSPAGPSDETDPDVDAPREAESSGPGEATPDDSDRAQREALLIARRIRAMMGADAAQADGPSSPSAGPMHVLDKDGTCCPIAYRDIVILLRSLKHKAGEYADVLRQCGIPVHSDSGSAFFDSVEARDMLALLRVLDNQRQDVPLAAVLRWQLAMSPSTGESSSASEAPSPEADLAAIRLAFAHETPPPPFCEAVMRYAAEREDELALRLQHILAMLGSWRDLAARRPLAEVIWTIYEQSGYLAYVAGLPNGRQRVANLMHLHQRARQFGGFQRQGLFRFLRFLEQLKERLDQPSVASAAEDAVRIMSIHAAKGLEFPVVFLADLGKRFNFADTQGSILLDRGEGIGLKVADQSLRVRYPSLPWMILHERLKARTLAEELRLLYVAMTRARECLICVGTARPPALSPPPARNSGNGQATGELDPFPPEMILSAKMPLDWLVPAAQRLTSVGTFDLTIWDPQQVSEWPTPRQMRPTLNPWQRDRASLKPLDPAPPLDPAAQAIIDRMIRPYAYEPFTQLPAAIAATSQKADRAQSPADGQPALFSLKSPLPQTAGGPLTATEIGSATHAALQFLDFSRPCDETDLRDQIDRMRLRHQLSPEQAATVDLEDLRWLLTTPPGMLLRQYADRLMRELPFTWGRSPEGLAAADPLDRQMIRGRLDVLIPTDGGLVLLDYKTDRVTGQRLNERGDLYHPQLATYAQALAEITGRKVSGAYLIFLHARQIRAAGE